MFMSYRGQFREFKKTQFLVIVFIVKGHTGSIVKCKMNNTMGMQGYILKIIKRIHLDWMHHRES